MYIVGDYASYQYAHARELQPSRGSGTGLTTCLLHYAHARELQPLADFFVEAEYKLTLRARARVATDLVLWIIDNLNTYITRTRASCNRAIAHKKKVYLYLTLRARARVATALDL